MIIIFLDEIYDFAENSLGSDNTNREMLNALCSAASSELLGRLKEGTDVESIKTLFVTAAGVLALSMYIALGDNGSYSFRAGNLSVSASGGGTSAASLRKQAESILAGYISDRGFEFRSVEG